MPVCTQPQFEISPRPAHRPTASQFLANTGSLALQVSGPGRPSRLVRLRALKCTVGSAAGCTLRLRADGIDSLHCWILRGHAGTVIRRMNGVATLNGAHFDEAMLVVGDRVSIGSVEMVVVDCNTALPSAQIPVEATLWFNNEVQSLQARLNASLEQIERLEVESRQGVKSSIMAAERADQLRDALAETNQQLEEVCGELTAAQDTIAAQAAELEAQTAKLRALNIDDQSTREKIERLENQASAAVAQCESLTSQLSELRAVQTAEHENWTQERKQLTQRCEQLTAELQSLAGELSARSEAATLVFEQHALAGATADARLDELTLQLTDRESEIKALKHLLDVQTIITSRLEQLTCDYEHKCHQLNDLQGRYDELSARSMATQELEQKGQELEKLQTELTERETFLTNATRAMEEERTALASKSQDLDAMRDDLAQEQQRLTDLRRELEQENAGFADLDQRRAELDQRSADLESRSAEIEVRAAELSSQAAAKQSQAPLQTMPFAAIESNSVEIETKAAELDVRAAEINSRVGELQQLLEQLVDQRAKLASREQELCDQYAKQEASSQCQVAECAAHDELPVRSHDSQGAESQYVEEAASNRTDLGTGNLSAPSSGAELEPATEPNEEAEMSSVLSRLVQAGVWRQGGDENAEAPAIAEAPVAAEASAAPEIEKEAPVSSTMVFEAPTFQRPQMKRALAGGDDEESIESYMDRLMKRVRGDGADGQSSWKSPSPSDSLTPAPTAESLVNARPARELSDSQAAEYSPRRTAPELPTNLSAMRDLANSAARTAIDQHVRLHSSRRATRKLFGACVTVGFSLVMAYWAWRIHSFQAAVGAGLGGAIGGYWTMAALRRLTGLTRLDREKEKSAAVPTAAAEPTPPQPKKV